MTDVRVDVRRRGLEGRDVLAHLDTLQVCRRL